LGREERLALICYCSDHAVAECSRCGRTYREIDLVTDYPRGGTHLCPGCHADLTESARQHLDTCAMLPEEVRKRARASREAARNLVKQSCQLPDHADVLMREVEATIATLRDTWRQSGAKDPDALRLLVRLKLADGRLPHAGIPPTIAGVAGDELGALCCAPSVEVSASRPTPASTVTIVRVAFMNPSSFAGRGGFVRLGCRLPCF
jgi:hypothetical protein